jgi:hypothetical protein
MDAAKEASKRRKYRSWAVQGACYVLSAGCLIWVLHGYPIHDLWTALRELDWKWVALAMLTDLAIYLATAWRWNTLLTPVVRLSLWRTAQVIYIGLFANEVLPLRSGELIRCYLLAHWNNFRPSLGFASAAVERIIDGFWMIGLFIITASLIRGVPSRLVLAVQTMGIVVLIAAAVLFWIIRRKPDAHDVFDENRWAAGLRHIVEGLHLMGNPRTLAATVLISLLCLVLQFASLWFMMKAYELDLSIWAAAGALAIIRLWTVVPNAPGNIGLVNVACITALRLFDVEENAAKTFSIIMFAALTLPLLLGGAVAVALTGTNIADLRDRAKLGAGELERPA